MTFNEASRNELRVAVLYPTGACNRTERSTTWNRSWPFKVAAAAFLVMQGYLPLLFAAESLKDLVEAAKKEGEVVIYGSMSLSNAEALRARFQQKYPFIQAKLNRVGGGKILGKVMTEFRAKKYLPDVIQALEFDMYTFRKNGVMGAYRSPEDQFYPNDFKEDGYWTPIYINPYVVAYNTKLVSAGGVPKTYDDLLRPEWKNKMMLEKNKEEWFAGMLQIFGHEKGLNYMRALAQQNLALREGHSLIIQLVAAGEAALDVNIPLDFVDGLAKKGAPVNWVGLGPVPTIISGVGVSAHAPHPNAARLFTNFVRSKEGQELMLSFGKRVARSDLTDRQTERGRKPLQLVPVNPALAEKLQEYSNMLREIFSAM
jgi:iron(III) transport system substrate-binding protein